MTYHLKRLSDGAGDSGPMSEGLYINDQDEIVTESPAKPRVGLSMKVGTFISRTFAQQDWWQTTPVTEVLEETKDTVRFKTRSGSEYLWRET